MYSITIQQCVWLFYKEACYKVVIVRLLVVKEPAAGCQLCCMGLQVAALVPLSTVAMEYSSLVQLLLPSVDKMIEDCTTSSSQLR